MQKNLPGTPLPVVDPALDDMWLYDVSNPFLPQTPAPMPTQMMMPALQQQQCYPVLMDQQYSDKFLLDQHMMPAYSGFSLNGPIHQLQLLGQDPLPEEEKKWLQENIHRLSMEQQFALRQSLQDCGDSSFFTLIGDLDLTHCSNETLWKIYDYTKAILNNQAMMPNLLMSNMTGMLGKRKRSMNSDGPQMKRQKLVDDPSKFTIKIEVVSGKEQTDGRYECHVCNQVLYDKSNFEKHTRTHTKEKKYQCKICKKFYGHSQTLKEHMFTHLKMKPFKCTTCGKGFASAANLKRHLRIHTGVKPYKCEICSRRFNQSGNLKAHIKRMHKDRDQ